MAVKHYDLARMTTATTGTGTITLGSAATGFLSFAGAGVQNGDTITYAIEDGNNREVGRGVYTASGTTLTRTVLSSTNANALISLSGTAQVFIALAAEDLGGLAPSGGASGYVLSKNSSSDYDFTWLAPAAGATTLAALTDVDESTAPTDGQLLLWNASAGKWQPHASNGLRVPRIADFTTTVNVGGTSLSQTTRGPTPNLTVQNTNNISNNCALYLMSAPSPPYLVTAKIRGLFYPFNAPWMGTHACIYNSGNGHILRGGGISDDTNDVWVSRWANTSSQVAILFGGTKFSVEVQWYQISNDGTTLTTKVSIDGVNWLTLYSEAISTYMGAVTHIGLASSNNSGHTLLSSIEHFYVGANEGYDFVLLAPAAEATTLAVPVSVPATPPATAVQLFALYDAVPPMTSNTAPSGYTASASSAHSQAPAWGAFQSKLLGAYSGVGAGWITNATTTGWLQIQLPSAVVVSAYELASLPQFPARTPAAWTLAGSNDGTTWTTIDTQSGQTVDYWQTGATASVTQSLPRTFYVLGSATAYAYYRLTITANNGDGSYLAISQFKLLSATPNNFAPPNLYLMDANGSLAKIALLNQYGSWT